MDADTLRASVAAAYRAVLESARAIGRYPARFWNFIPDIGERMPDGLNRYMVFNAGRHDACNDRRGAVSTASALGIQGKDLYIHCVALDEPGTPVENPRQTPAWLYSARYGPTPPYFSRATIADMAGRRTLLIGGTASVLGEDSQHPGQLDAQLEETLRNLEALIRTAAEDVRDAESALRRLIDLRGYVTSAAMAQPVREVLERRCPRARNIAVAVAQICRPELLLEIEGLADF